MKSEIIIDLRFLRRKSWIFMGTVAVLALILLGLRLGRTRLAQAQAKSVFVPSDNPTSTEWLIQENTTKEIEQPLELTPTPGLLPTSTPFLRSSSQNESEKSVSPAFPDCVQCEPDGLPVPAGKGVAVTCRFRDPAAPAHKGLDLAIPVNTEVRATHDGMVVKAAYDPQYGNLVVVQNSFYSTWYAHNAYLLVREGDQVHCGDLLALSGSTGKSTGPHLHYEVHDNQDTPLNPEDYLGEDSEVLKFRGCNPGGEK